MDLEGSAKRREYVRNVRVHSDKVEEMRDKESRMEVGGYEGRRREAHAKLGSWGDVPLGMGLGLATSCPERIRTRKVEENEDVSMTSESIVRAVSKYVLENVRIQ